jgi:ankyrin repeat protein
MPAGALPPPDISERRMKGYPKLGKVLSDLIVSAGFRKAFEEVGEEKTLNDLSRERRSTTLLDNLYCCEDLAARFIGEDLGLDWARFLWNEWGLVKKDLQTVTSSISFYQPEDGKSSYFQAHIESLLTAPLIARFLRRAAAVFGSPPLATWLQAPLDEWIRYCSSVTGLDERESWALLGPFSSGDPENVDRTLRRWRAGERPGLLATPYSRLVVLGSSDRTPKRALMQVAAWLCITRAVLEMPEVLNAKVRQLVRDEKVINWNASKFIKKMLSDDPISRDLLRYQQERFPDMLSLFRQVNIFEDGRLIIQQLRAGQKLGLAQVKVSGSEFDFLMKWLEAINFANDNQSSDALLAYDEAVDFAWWKAGISQVELIKEAMIYAVGMANRKDARRYWNLLQLLGVVSEQESKLEDANFYRFAYTFEAYFPGITPKTTPDSPPGVLFSTQKTDVKRPRTDPVNRIFKIDGTNERTTQLVSAVKSGELRRVEKLLSHGADVNIKIKKANSTALSAALYAALEKKRELMLIDMLADRVPWHVRKERKNFLKISLRIIHSLLDATPRPSLDTVNSEDFAEGEKPMKLAIELGDAEIVEKLIRLGADRQHGGRKSPCLLTYCMTLFRNATEGAEPDLHTYASGDSFSDSFELQAGVLLKQDKVFARNTIVPQQHLADDASRAKFSEMMKRCVARPDDIRGIMKMLLAKDRRYPTEPADPNKEVPVRRMIERFTPTLYAAELGDLEIFEILVEAGGKWKRPLYPFEVTGNIDALGIALHHGKQDIVDFLKRLEKPETASAPCPR